MTRTRISAESVWSAIAAGALAGVGGWYLNFDETVWPAHPKQALFWTTLAVATFVQVVVELKVRKREGHR